VAGYSATVRESILAFPDPDDFKEVEEISCISQDVRPEHQTASVHLRVLPAPQVTALDRATGPAGVGTVVGANDAVAASERPTLRAHARRSGPAD